jgi:hypothetical protein
VTREQIMAARMERICSQNAAIIVEIEKTVFLGTD